MDYSFILTNVVDDATAVVLQTGGVADKTIAGHLADDLDVARLGAIIKLPGGNIEEPLCTL